MDCSLPGSSVCGISQVRIQEWVAFPSPGDLPNPGIEPASPALQVASLQLRHWGSSNFRLLLLLSCFSCVQLLATPWTAAYQAPPSMGVSRQEYQSGLPLPSLKLRLDIDKRSGFHLSLYAKFLHRFIRKHAKGSI